MGVSNIMRIAIIGAGLAGLSCAHELQRLGQVATIFEQKDRVGYPFSETNIYMKLMHRPIPDILDYFKEKYELSLTPMTRMKELYLHGSERTAHIKGDLGYFMDLSNSEKSVHSQILKELKCPIVFETKADYGKLAKEFDHVIIATGVVYNNVAKELGLWEDEFSFRCRVGAVTGSYQPNTLIAWRDRNVSLTGYAYLCPLSDKRAKLALILPGEIEKRDIDVYWGRFLDTAKIDTAPLEYADINVPTGKVKNNILGKYLLVGDAGGFLEPFLGLGGLAAIETGIIAARSIVYNLDFNKEINLFRLKRERLSAIKRTADKVGNGLFNLIVATENLPGIKQLIYKSSLELLELAGLTFQISERVLSKSKKK